MDRKETGPAEEGKEPCLEERFLHLEGILGDMEKPDVTLEQSFALYQQGLEELKAASEMLDGMEKAMQVMASDGSLEDFDAD